MSARWGASECCSIREVRCWSRCSSWYFFYFLIHNLQVIYSAECALYCDTDSDADFVMSLALLKSSHKLHWLFKADCFSSSFCWWGKLTKLLVQDTSSCWEVSWQWDEQDIVRYWKRWEHLISVWMVLWRSYGLLSLVRCFSCQAAPMVSNSNTN